MRGLSPDVGAGEPDPPAARGLTILIIEHNLGVVRSISERVIVLHHGAMIAEGGADEILRAPQVVEAYLGGRREWKPS